MPDCYEALGLEAFGYMRPWEIRKLTDAQIEGMFAANHRQAEYLKSRYSEVYGPPSAGGYGRYEEKYFAAGIKHQLEEGGIPSRAQLISMLLQMPGMTQEEAARQADYQLAELAKETHS